MSIHLVPAWPEYKTFTCSDCHPDYHDEDSEGPLYEFPYEIILPVDGELVKGTGDGSCPINSCPRCGSHLSMCTDSLVKVERVRG